MGGKGGKEGSDDSKRKSIGAVAILLIVALVIVLLGIVLVVYRIWLRKELNREMRLQVNSAVSQYIALSESNH